MCDCDTKYLRSYSDQLSIKNIKVPTKLSSVYIQHILFTEPLMSRPLYALPHSNRVKFYAEST